jgi:predicted transcriptional regulator of viral defense system
MNSEIYDHKTLLLNYIDEYGQYIFNLLEIENIFGAKYPSVFRAIKSLANDGLLINLQKGLYCKPSFSNQYVLAYYLAPKGAVAYWSALSYYGLSTQFSNTIFVQTPLQIKSKVVMGIAYQFILVKPNKAMQYEIIGRGNAKFAITSLEKTLVDCFDQMNYSAGWNELIKALYKGKFESQKLIAACEAVGNISVIKRLGYLLELMQKPNSKTFIKYAKAKTRQKYSLLDPSSEEGGSYHSKWKLRLNVSESDILENLENIY